MPKKSGGDETSWKDVWMIWIALFQLGTNASLTLPFAGYYENQYVYLYYPLLQISYLIGRFISYFIATIMLKMFSMRDVLISCLFIQALTTLFLGLSTSLPMIMIIRLISGFMAWPLDFANNLIKTYTITSPASTQKALKRGNLCYMGGFIFSMILGSLLAYPAKTGLESAQIFKDYPFLLNWLILGSLQIFGVFVILLDMQEPSYSRHAELQLEKDNKTIKNNSNNSDASLIKPPPPAPLDLEEQNSSQPPSGPITVRNDWGEEQWDEEYSEYGLDLGQYLPGEGDSTGIDVIVPVEPDRIELKDFQGDRVEAALENIQGDADPSPQSEYEESSEVAPPSPSPPGSPSNSLPTLFSLATQPNDMKSVASAANMERINIEDHHKRQTVGDEKIWMLLSVRVSLTITFLFSLWMAIVQEYLFMWILIKLEPTLIVFGLGMAVVYLSASALSALTFQRWMLRIRARLALLLLLCLSAFCTLLADTSILSIPDDELIQLCYFFGIFFLVKVFENLTGFECVIVAADAVASQNLIAMLKLGQQATLVARILGLIAASVMVLEQFPGLIWWALLLVIPCIAFIKVIRAIFPRLEIP